MASKSAHAGTAIDLGSLVAGRKRLSSTLSPIDGTAPAKQLAKKRRNREAANLGVTAHEERYLPETSTVWYARLQRNRNPAASKRKAANAAQDSWATYREWQAECVTWMRIKIFTFQSSLGKHSWHHPPARPSLQGWRRLAGTPSVMSTQRYMDVPPRTSGTILTTTMACGFPPSL